MVECKSISCFCCWYRVIVRPLQLQGDLGVVLSVNCVPGKECSSPDSTMGAFEAGGRVYIFEFENEKQVYQKIFQSFTLVE